MFNTAPFLDVLFEMELYLFGTIVDGARSVDLTCQFGLLSYNLPSIYSVTLQIQNEGYYLQLAAKDALLNSLLVAAKKFTSGPPQVLVILL